MVYLYQGINLTDFLIVYSIGAENSKRKAFYRKLKRIKKITKNGFSSLIRSVIITSNKDVVEEITEMLKELDAKYYVFNIVRKTQN